MPVLPSGLMGLGRRPALIVVDATLGFTDPSSPLGTESGPELAAIARLLGVFRGHGLPVVFTTNSYADPSLARVFREKLPSLNLLVAGGEWARIDPHLEPAPGELVLNKGVPSAFFESPLRRMLLARGVDSTLVCGFTTSGCVRATAVDAVSSDFRVVVAREACGDRDREAHASNLRDLGLKYADVVSLDEAVALVEAVAPEPPEPTGR